jgi:glycosyltransferase involved in cell wall biosynthesis
MKAHVLILADGRSPTALSWIKHLQALGYRVSLVSTYPCDPPANLVQFHPLPIAFSQFSAGPGAKGETRQKPHKKVLRRLSPILLSLRYWLGPLSLARHAKPYQALVHQIQPDIVHALRIPFEGMLGSYTPDRFPFLVSTWGNDLTLHAHGSRSMQKFTRRCLARANGITSDTRRDIRLAKDWGLDNGTPSLVIPGSGGLDLDAIKNAGAFNPVPYHIPTTGPWVINPRGVRPGSVHQEAFFAAIPKVLQHHPQAQFICPSLGGLAQAQGWVEAFSIQGNIHLLPKLPQTELWSLFRSCQVFVSPSSHDGTPNTLLEAMACGCLPVVGDIESLREWIELHQNGILVDPQNPHQIAEAILKALDDENLRLQAARLNIEIIKNRADQNVTRPMLDQFYTQFID